MLKHYINHNSRGNMSTPFYPIHFRFLKRISVSLSIFRVDFKLWCTKVSDTRFKILRSGGKGDYLSVT